MFKKKKLPLPKKENLAIRIILFVIISFLFALNIRLFIKPINLLPGGLAGVSLLIQQLCIKTFGFEPPYAVINLVLNLVPIYIGFRFIGKKFTFLSCIVVVLSSIFVDLIPAIKPWTDELLLYSIFGGIIHGALLSMCLLLGGTTGGTDFISIYYSEQKGVDAWNYILAFNVIVLLISGMNFGFEPALFSIIFQYVATQVVKTMYTRYQQSTMFIVTKEANKIHKAIGNLSHHGSTLFHGKGAYEGKGVDLVYSVVNTDEVDMIIKEVRQIDSHAFVNVIKTDRINGRFYNRPKE